MVHCEDGTCIFGTDDAREYLACHGVPSHRIDDFAELRNCDDNVIAERELIDSDTLEEMTGR